jgi:hypothetical protein
MVELVIFRDSSSLGSRYASYTNVVRIAVTTILSLDLFCTFQFESHGVGTLSHLSIL